MRNSMRNAMLFICIVFLKTLKFFQLFIIILLFIINHSNYCTLQHSRCHTSVFTLNASQSGKCCQTAIIQTQIHLSTSLMHINLTTSIASPERLFWTSSSITHHTADCTWFQTTVVKHVLYCALFFSVRFGSMICLKYLNKSLHFYDEYTGLWSF